MSSITAQQTKLDLELVPKENKLNIEKCNGRIPHGLIPREPTFQVVMDAIALTPCYPAFFITADVPEVYMHQFWNSVYKHDTFYRFNIDKKKQFKLTLEVFIDIFQIYPRVPGRNFDALPSKEDTVSFLRELSHNEEINSFNDKNVDYVELLWEDFIYQIETESTKSKKRCTIVDSLKLSFTKITPTVTSEGIGDKPGVPDVIEDDLTLSESESWGNDEDDNNDDNDSENEDNDEENRSDDDKTPSDSEKGLDSEQDTNGSESDSESNQQEYEEEVKDDDEDADDDDYKFEGDKDRGMDDTTNQFNDDVQDKKADVEMTDAQQEKKIQRSLKNKLLKMIILSVQPNSNALEKDVAELKKDPLHTQVIALVDDHLDTRMGATRVEFMNFLLASLTDKITKQRSRQDKDKDEGPFAGSDRRFKKRKRSKDAELTTGQEGNLGNDDVKPRKEFASRRDWFTKPSRPQEPTDADWNVDKTSQKGPTQNCSWELVGN
nr:hypothetical protein [Tanacetum cinerariifolium]